jgi:hypothetical protein
VDGHRFVVLPVDVVGGDCISNFHTTPLVDGDNERRGSRQWYSTRGNIFSPLDR